MEPMGEKAKNNDTHEKIKVGRIIEKEVKQTLSDKQRLNRRKQKTILKPRGQEVSQKGK